MKKLLLFLLAMTLLLCLCACGGKEEKSTPKNNEDKVTSSTASTEATQASRTQILYGTNADGTIVTQIVAVPDTDPTAIQATTATTAPQQSTTTTAEPTFTYEDENQFNDATLAW